MAHIRLTVAEDNLLVREGLCSLLATSPAIDVCGVADDFDTLIALVEADPPDVVLTDIRMPPTHTDEGVQISALLRRTHPEVGVVVLSQFADPDYVLSVFQEGSRGRGYMLKDRVSDVNRLVAALETIARGGSFIDDEIVDVLMTARRRGHNASIAELTERELAVLAEIASGKANSAIAASLNVSEHAIEKHTSAIFAKLGIENDRESNRRVKAVLVYLADRQS